MTRRKPKFKVGQVLRIKQGYMYEGFLGHVGEIREERDHLEYHLCATAYSKQWAAEWTVRPLTKRERQMTRAGKDLQR